VVEAAILEIPAAALQSLCDAHRQNICDNLLGILLKQEGKPKDTVNARLDLADMGIRPHFHCC
jgi:hypothetical protein